MPISGLYTTHGLYLLYVAPSKEHDSSLQEDTLLSVEVQQLMSVYLLAQLWERGETFGDNEMVPRLPFSELTCCKPRN